MPATPKLLFDGPADAAQTIALAHGAGAGMDTPFMNAFAQGLASRGFRVARFEFAYMASYRRTGQKKPPDREPLLRATWFQVIELLGRERLVIGGKSMGGRIASLVADEAKISGLVCLGYPFHPTDKANVLRVDHLKVLATPTLMCQGTRDPFGTREEVKRYRLSTAIRVHWLEDGDHGFKPRKSSGRTEPQNWEEAVAAIAAFVNAL
jgi:predicted alpha/beta-hydrolase family hydrolase